MPKGAGGRPAGRRDNPMNRRVRNESDAAKKRRIEKTATTRKEREAERKAEGAKSNTATAKAAKKAAAGTAPLSNFFGRKKAPTSIPAASAIAPTNANTQIETNNVTGNAAAPEAVPDMLMADNGNNGEELSVASAAAPEMDMPTIDSVVPVTEIANEIVTNFDVDDNEKPADYYDSSDGDHEKFEEGKPLGVQQAVNKVITERLKEEVCERNKSTDTWLLNHLRENDWWIRKEHARKFVKKLGVKKAEHDAYYRDIYVWLPDIKYGQAFMPCCPSCKSNKGVGNNGFRENHFGRLIVGMRSTYYAISRRYRCYDCEKRNNDLCGVTALEEAFEDHGVDMERRVDNLQYSFMGWDKRIMHLYPNGIGMEFPAFLTWRCGLDNLVVDLMRPMFNKGIKPAQFANMLLEMHSAEFDRLRLLHEYKNKSIRTGVNPNTKITPLGDYSNELKFRGIRVTGKYLSFAYIEHHNTIRPFYDKEVKKRGAESLTWDLSFKEAKNLAQYHGKPIFSGLVTALNGRGEIRVQYHVCTESHEQMISALQAFERTRISLGLPGCKHIFLDNPYKDRSLFLTHLPSVREQQEKYNKSTQQTEASIPSYPFEKLDVHKATSAPEINAKVMAMKDVIGSNKILGFDTEWNRLCRSYGAQYGRSRIQWIQIAYRDDKKNVGVLLLWVGGLKKLPSSLETLLCDDTLTFVGNKVSTDLKFVGEDFQIHGLTSVDQNERENVKNLGVFARVRDVVQSGIVGLDTLARLTLNLIVDKTCQVSTWTRELETDQEKYAAIDAAVSLEIFEVLVKMPDLTCKLTVEEATDGKKVDLIPKNGSVACMATRAATGTIVQRNEYNCPEGYWFKTRQGRRKSVAVGKGSFIVKIDTIEAPGLVLPNYIKPSEPSAKEVTLGDVGAKEILVPLAMLKEHVACDNVRATPIHQPITGRTQPATEPTPRKSDRGRVPRKRDPVDGYESDESDSPNSDVEEELDNDLVSDEELDNDMKELTSRDIELLRAAIFDSEKILEGKMPMQCDKLDDPPNPEDIPNRFSACLGDPFHEMDRPNPSSNKHEFKKAYFVALREACFIWNPIKLNKLRTKMISAGLSDKQIDAQMYYNARFFRECVERIVPPPKILYYRLRAVFVLFGEMVDSKTKQPLFNDKAWKKAKSVLRDAREGLFSDPPDVEFYSLKLGPNGEAMKNKYGLEKLECMRGTPRVEACHKHLHVTFRNWHVGIEMSNCLLGEFRHRYNHNVSQRRRFGYPKIPHYNLWMIDQIQNLMVENHGIQPFPHWTNASDFRTTDESFDIIPLQSETLHEALEERCKELNDIKLTREQAYAAKSMGTTLPFLPVVHSEEKKAFAKLVLNGKGKPDFDVMAVEWCKYVDGENIMPKLPSQLRTYFEEWSRNQRVEESNKKARPGIVVLDELNRVITPLASNDNSTQLLWKEPKAAAPLLQPPPQALRDTAEVAIVGGISVGNDAPSSAATSQGKRKRRCGVCRGEKCKGSGGRRYCQLLVKQSVPRKRKMDGDGTLSSTKRRQCQLCVMHGQGKHPNCIIGNGNRKFCKYYHYDGSSK
ncbi:hypothetical protein ACHAWT_002097 [Skeletonema menzelii]